MSGGGELVLRALAILFMAGGLVVVPFGLPGTWGMLLVVVLGGAAGWVSWPIVGVLAAAVAVAEVLEFLVLRSMSARYGGSRKAFWGAVAGGFIGLFVGLPIPLVGPVITGFLGTFAGAAAVTWVETRSLDSAGRVGWGVFVARVMAAGIKVGTGVGVLVVGGGAILLD